MNKVSESISQLYKPKKRGQSIDPYPWFDDNDPRRHQSDEEILHNTIDLSKSVLAKSEKKKLMQIIIKNKKAFSLRDEIGECPNLQINLNIADESPFFV